jgi:hypothetical protein
MLFLGFEVVKADSANLELRKQAFLLEYWPCTASNALREKQLSTRGTHENANSEGMAASYFHFSFLKLRKERGLQNSASVVFVWKAMTNSRFLE